MRRESTTIEKFDSRRKSHPTSRLDFFGTVPPPKTRTTSVILQSSRPQKPNFIVALLPAQQQLVAAKEMRRSDQSGSAFMPYGKGHRTRNDADLMAMASNQESVRKVDFLHSKSLCSQNRLPANDSHKLSMTCAANFTFLAGWAILAP
ncbi:hypothetical protein C7B82_12295 [Stenomitos frigidus ULC18]|uniref:Uncharacterized protein n=1 Tax=Stenomitos frigidus ULC18 TaxID=2107698 RepID=A0A2T1E8P3_9CYAN|nr:hypothetical protein C7B82_12295 [Stenomitos frigidus ULC18]